METNLSDDPAESAYKPIAMNLQSISWEDFENLVEKLLWEIGFSDVHRLTRGSQQGKDIIGTWESRFVLGRRVQFRFQCKHKQTGGYLTKKDLGDSLSDFLLQNKDEILVNVTNAQLSNDLIDQMDKASEAGVYAISQNQLIRLISSCPKIAKTFLKLTPNICESIRQSFETMDWIETICSNRPSNDLKLTLHRFWTEPYTWFFYQQSGGKISREWTTFGGEFRLGCYNLSNEIQEISGLTLRLIDRQPLPKFAIVNITPKGGQNLKHIDIPLSEKLGSFEIGPEKQYLVHGEFYNCLVNFQPKNPGIYKFQILLEGSGGSRRIRESAVFTIVSLPKTLPSGYVNLHESWPRSFLIIETLIRMAPSERQKILGPTGKEFILFRKESGELVIKYWSKLEANDFVPDCKELPVNHPHADKIYSLSNGATMIKYHHLLEWHDWTEEWFDTSEPRAPLRRARLLLSHGSNDTQIHDALQKAHERAPWHPKLNAQYAAVYYSLGYRGFAQFHMEVAYTVTPTNPIIAGMHFLLKKIFAKQPEKSSYIALLRTELGKQGFMRLVSLSDDETIRFPKSYFDAAKISFPNNPDLQDEWSAQAW
jgi:hypothetical protein